MELVLFAALMSGLAIVAHAVVQTMARGVNIDAAIGLLARLAGESYKRLVGFAGALPSTILEAVRAAAACGTQLARGDAPPTHALVEGQVMAAFDTTAAALLVRWRATRDRALAGAILVFGTVALAVGDGVATVLHVVAPIAAAGGTAFVFVRRAQAIAGLARLRAEVAPLVVDAVVTGRALADLAAPTKPRTPDAIAFTIERAGSPPRVLELAQPIIKIGKLATAHVELPDDDAVSRMHAIIERDADGVRIIDLGSSAGTRINGETVNKATLASGDRIAIGGYTITVALDGAPIPPVDDGPLRTAQPPAHPTPPPGPSLRDGACPICHHTVIKTVARTDSRFEAKVCAGCGFTQEFADLAKL